MEMYLVAGLGNPDKKYEDTRHNAGFRAVEALADKLGVSISEKRFKGLSCTAVHNGRKLLLLKPLTYMNLSGESVAEAASFYKIEPSHIIVLLDDVYFDCGRMRIRGSGSAGGHNGMKNIILKLGTDAFPRVRIGVGDKGEHDMISHVLGRFDGAERKLMDEVSKAAADAALSIIDEGVPAAMNKYNGLDLAAQDGTE